MNTQQALKLCLRVLRPIAEDRVYETRWLQDAIDACKEALESQAQPLSDDEIEKLWYELYPLNNNNLWDDMMKGKHLYKFARAIEKAHGIE